MTLHNILLDCFIVFLFFLFLQILKLSILIFSPRNPQDDLSALTHMAEQINPKLTENAGDSVDLDNLFAFLSDVQQSGRNPIIDEIGKKMNELVSDLDVEVTC